MNVHDPSARQAGEPQTGTRRRYSDAVLMVSGRCPGGCSTYGPTGVIYRSSKRSVTMRCSGCGLQWTMTIHRLAQTARRRAELMGSDEYAQAEALMAARLETWANWIDDRRGRRRHEP